eukprot:TRINITY_DN883_c0_g1_i4.p1 TRINITY_DN883_c0_g1~~TRINITY_DN883_c0_g1_i4.p1  ORF type:complete len:911 (-),score=304.98 TRINITY_DN883_c0_g1_i4:1534-4266(-)
MLDERLESTQSNHEVFSNIDNELDGDIAAESDEESGGDEKRDKSRGIAKSRPRRASRPNRQLEEFEVDNVLPPGGEDTLNPTFMNPPSMPNPRRSNNNNNVPIINNVNNVPASHPRASKPRRNRNPPRTTMEYYPVLPVPDFPIRVPKEKERPPVPPKSRMGTRTDDPMTYCKKLLKNLMAHQYAWPFNTPVDPIALNIPDYPDIIKNPMDLGTIKDSLFAGMYTSVKDFAEDVRLVFDNAKLYNPVGTDVHYMADELSKIFEDQIPDIFQVEQAAPNSPALLKSQLQNTVETLKENEKKLEKQLQQLQRQISVREEEDEELHIPIEDLSPIIRPRSDVTNKEPMSFDDKASLSKMVNSLDRRFMNGLVTLLKEERVPSLRSEAPVVEVDVDLLDPVVLRRIELYCNDCRDKKKQFNINDGATLTSPARSPSAPITPDATSTSSGGSTLSTTHDLKHVGSPSSSSNQEKLTETSQSQPPLSSSSADSTTTNTNTNTTTTTTTPSTSTTTTPTPSIKSTISSTVPPPPPTEKPSKKSKKNKKKNKEAAAGGGGGSSSSSSASSSSSSDSSDTSSSESSDDEGGSSTTASVPTISTVTPSLPTITTSTNQTTTTTTNTLNNDSKSKAPPQLVMPTQPVTTPKEVVLKNPDSWSALASVSSSAAFIQSAVPSLSINPSLATSIATSLSTPSQLNTARLVPIVPSVSTPYGTSLPTLAPSLSTPLVALQHISAGVPHPSIASPLMTSLPTTLSTPTVIPDVADGVGIGIDGSMVPGSALWSEFKQRAEQAKLRELEKQEKQAAVQLQLKEKEEAEKRRIELELEIKKKEEEELRRKQKDQEEAALIAREKELQQEREAERLRRQQSAPSVNLTSQSQLMADFERSLNTNVGSGPSLDMNSLLGLARRSENDNAD